MVKTCPDDGSISSELERRATLHTTGAGGWRPKYYDGW